ncbi:hypothetical protein BOW86_gp255 [Synechococcus phage S-CAM7]|nr:hypothetical protein BOW86_gp255 [Synechococcus phage S-CAM7]AOV62126.1 hypothetical protein C490910_202 [Synechococcus phage S-CAM7]AOV62390.1 hypothetical protein S420910_202 [Synechococcus phage S-CAM7]
MVEVISRLDATIEKLSDLSVNVSRMLAVHEEKLDFARETAAETAKDIDELEERLDEKMEAYSVRLRSVERRVWVGLGVALAVTLILQSPIVFNMLHHTDKSAIMVPRN